MSIFLDFVEMFIVSVNFKYAICEAIWEAICEAIREAICEAYTDMFQFQICAWKNILSLEFSGPSIL